MRQDVACLCATASIWLFIEIHRVLSVPDGVETIRSSIGRLLQILAFQTVHYARYRPEGLLGTVFYFWSIFFGHRVVSFGLFQKGCKRLSDLPFLFSSLATKLSTAVSLFLWCVWWCDSTMSLESVGLRSRTGLVAGTSIERRLRRVRGRLVPCLA